MFSFSRFRALPIRQKLVIMIMTTSLLILVLGTGTLLGIEIYRMRNNIQNDLIILADITAENCAAPLLFQDEVAAREVLSHLHHHPSILQASVRDTADVELASYSTSAARPLTYQPELAAAGHVFSLKQLQLYRNVRVKGEQVGSIRMIYDLKQIYQRIFEYSMLMLALIAGFALLSRVLANNLQRYISLPLLQLGEAAHKVAETKDYSIRATKQSDDETGALVERFNEMLSLVQERDQRLESVMDGLEEKVRLRTADLEAEKEKAERALRVKTNFLANMSHEIRTPMIGVLGMAELLREQDLAADNLSMVETIHRSAEALLIILNDILDFSKIEAGRLELRPIPTDVLRLAKEVVSLLIIGARSKGIDIELNLPAAAPQVLVDPVRFRQILINLVGNAVKFTEVGKVSLSLSITAVGGEGLCDCQILVEDTGVGIPRELHEQIFDSFTQGDGDLVLNSTGTGLGLTIVRVLVGLMKGSVTLNSTPGEGSRFSVQLPLALSRQVPAALSPEVPVNMPAKAQRPLSRADGRQLRILLAEDNLDTQKLLSISLQKMSFALVIVDNGLAALDFLAQEEVDLVLMDCRMPQLDGFKTTAQLRALGVTTPIVALTAFARAEEEQRCLAAGMDGFLSKPFTQAALRRILERWLDPDFIAPGQTENQE